MISTILASGGLLDDLGINPVVVGTQVVIFITTFVILSRVLFGRALSQIQTREEEIRKAQAGIEQDRAEAERLLKEYEAGIAKVDKEAYDRTQAMVKEAQASAQALTAKAQAQARAEVERGAEETMVWKASLRPVVRERCANFAFQVAEKMLQTKLDPAVQGKLAEQFVRERT